MTRMIDNFDRLLGWHYGDRQKLKETVLYSLQRYEAIQTPTERVKQRISDYRAIVAKCETVCN